jgi:hypothetical protein
MLSASMTSANHTVKPAASHEAYLGYLDTEMKIMGILSAFCVLTVAGIATAIKDFDLDKRHPTSTLWHQSSEYMVVGCLCMMAAALFFYYQRSHLAWCYGQICLAQFDSETYGSLDGWLDLANGWSSWRSYKAGFAAIGAAVGEFVLALMATIWPRISSNYFLLAIPVVIAVIYAGPMYYVMEHYNSKDEPWREWFRDLGTLLRKKKERVVHGPDGSASRGARTRRKPAPR